MPVTNKNQISCRNEGFGVLTYKCKSSGVIEHLPALSMAKGTIAKFHHVCDIYLPTCACYLAASRKHHKIKVEV